MKKNIIRFGLILCFLCSAVYAQTIKVSALESFSTAKPSNEFKIQTLQPLEIKEDVVLPEGTLISGIVCKVEGPRRGKRDGYFEFIPTSLIYNDQKINIDVAQTVAKIVGYEPVDAKTVVTSVAKKSIGLFYKGATQGISLIEGMIQAENGNRLKSGFTKMYKDSPLSYIEVGDELNIQTGDILTLKIKKIR